MWLCDLLVQRRWSSSVRSKAWTRSCRNAWTASWSTWVATFSSHCWHDVMITHKVSVVNPACIWYEVCSRSGSPCSTLYDVMPSLRYLFVEKLKWILANILLPWNEQSEACHLWPFGRVVNKAAAVVNEGVGLCAIRLICSLPIICKQRSALKLPCCVPEIEGRVWERKKKHTWARNLSFLLLL